MRNLNQNVVNGFGREWLKFDQSDLPREELREIFEGYFDLFPWEKISQKAVGFDLGCGSGRWAAFVAPRVGVLHCIDPSPEALSVARKNLKEHSNCRFHLATADRIPIPEASADFGYSIGVLHHIPDTCAALKAAGSKLKPGAPFLVYLYYAFDNRPKWFRFVWIISEIGRSAISKMPYSLRYWFSQFIAFSIYFPLARVAFLLENMGLKVDSFPLSYYRNRDFYVMRNDALDRFGTALEKRFSRKEIQEMMWTAGLEEIRFGDKAPYWCAIGIKKEENR